jgi:hypothetical protein
VDADEEAQEWPRFQTAADTPIEVTGDADWGKAKIYDGSPGLSNVLDLGSSTSRTITVTQNKYGTGDTGTVYIRGHDSVIFGQHAGTPSWEVYSAPVAKTWRYIQLRLSNE